MLDDWNQAITCEYSGGNACFDFPVRPLGAAKIMGVILIGFGICFDWVPAKMFWQNFAHAPATTSGSGGFYIVSILFEGGFLLGGLIPVVMGLVMLFGRCRVEWREGRLRSSERLGPFHWTRRLPKKPIARLLAAGPTAPNPSDGAVPRSRPRTDPTLSSLAVLYADGSKQALVLGYPQAWLVGVAQQLQGYVGGTAGAVTPVPVPVVAEVAAFVDDTEVSQRPANSRAEVSGSGNNVRVFLPALGLWKGAKGFFGFSLAWTVFFGWAFVVKAWAIFKYHAPSIGPLPLVLLFWVIGCAMLGVAVQAGLRRVELVVEGGQLRVDIKGPVRKSSKIWAKSDIAAIRVGPSNVIVNNRPLPALQIYPRAGKKRGMLAGRDEEELKWLATRLRQALQVPAQNG